jgi:Protein of unknown function (DUF1350)
MMLRNILFFVFCYTVAVAFSSIKPQQRYFSRLLRVSSSSTDPAYDLTSTLARLDQQWKIQQKKIQPRSRWTTLTLPKDVTKTESVAEGTEITDTYRQDYCYLLEPPNNSIPSCLIVFTGGAGLGTYPQIAYNEFLLRLSNRLNAAILTAPYQVSLDHFALAKETGDVTRRAILYCQDDPSRLYPDNIPIFSLSHSLGSKLSCIYITATEQNYDGIGYISFNNFSFGATIGMAKEFADTIRKSSGLDDPVSGISSDAMNTLFNFAEMAISAVGIDFSPSQSDMDRLMQLKYGEKQRRKTRFFSFDNDMLESTKNAWEACSGDATVSGLSGTHLTPVYFKLGIEDMELPEDAKEIARDAMGGLRNVSFGNDEELEELVSEVCDWIVGKEPKRKPIWLKEQPQIAGQSATTTSS